MRRKVGRRLGVLLDEDLVAVVAGGVAPWPATTPPMIDACQEISDLRRAQEWTATLAAWWATQPDMVTFTGQCLVHRAEIMRCGSAEEAVEEASGRVSGSLTLRTSTPPSTALYRRPRSIENVGTSRPPRRYREASQWGSSRSGPPRSGWLRKDAAAQAAIRQVVAETSDRLGQVKVLPAYVEIMLATADVPAAAREAPTSSSRSPTTTTCQPCAHPRTALGAVLLAEGEAGHSICEPPGMRTNSMSRTATERACSSRSAARRSGTGASAPNDAAGRVFAELGAAADLGVEHLAREQNGREAHGLTPQELQVLGSSRPARQPHHRCRSGHRREDGGPARDQHLHQARLSSRARPLRTRTSTGSSSRALGNTPPACRLALGCSPRSAWRAGTWRRDRNIRAAGIELQPFGGTCDDTRERTAAVDRRPRSTVHSASTGTTQGHGSTGSSATRTRH